MAQMAKEEIARLEAEEKKLAQELQFGIVPPNPTDSRNTIVEIRAGAGGSESALFAADLYRMYCRYAETRGWKIESMDSNPSDLGGFKEIIFGVTGTDVFKRFKYRERRASRPACPGHGSPGPRAHQHRDGRSAAGGGRSRPGDQSRRYRDQRLPRLRQRRPGRQYDRFRRANPAQALRTDCALRG